jgi:DNA-binding MarR family transcriptional regulator
MESDKVAKNLDKFLAKVEWLSTLGLTSRGLRLLLIVYMDEGKRITYYNKKVNEGRTEDELAKLIGKTSGYFTSFERLGLITKIPDETDARGQAKKIYLTLKVREILEKNIPLLCEEPRDC